MRVALEFFDPSAGFRTCESLKERKCEAFSPVWLHRASSEKARLYVKCIGIEGGRSLRCNGCKKISGVNPYFFLRVSNETAAHLKAVSQSFSLVLYFCSYSYFRWIFQLSTLSAVIITSLYTSLWHAFPLKILQKTCYLNTKKLYYFLL